MPRYAGVCPPRWFLCRPLAFSPTTAPNTFVALWSSVLCLAPRGGVCSWARDMMCVCVCVCMLWVQVYFPPIAIAALRLLVGSCGLLVITSLWYVITRGGRRQMFDWCSSRLRPGEQHRRASAGSSLTVSNGFILESGTGSASRGLSGTWVPLIAVGVLNTAIPYTLYGYGFDNGVLVGTAAIIAGSAPLMTAMLASCLLPATALVSGPGGGRYNPSLSDTPRMDLNNGFDSLEAFGLGRSGGSHASFASTSGVHAQVGRARTRVRRVVAGLVLGFLGIIALSVRSFEGAEVSSGFTIGQLVLGHAIIIFAIASKAMASILAHKYLAHLRVLPLAFAQTVVGACVCLVAALAVDYTGVESGQNAKGWQFLTAAPGHAWYSILYLGLCSSCIVYVLQFFLVQQAGAVRQMLVDYMTPVVGVVEGAIFKHEFAHMRPIGVVAEVIGVLLIGLGVFLVNHHRVCARSPAPLDRRRGSVLSETQLGPKVSGDRGRMSVERPKAFSVTEVPPTDYPMFAAPTDRLLDSDVHGGF